MKANVLILVAALLFMLAPYAARSQSPDISMSQIIQSLQQQQKLLQSVSGESTDANRRTEDFVRVYTSLGASKMEKPTTVTHLRTWAYKGEKKYSQYEEMFDPKDQTALHKITSRTTTELFDGNQHYYMLSSTYTGVSQPRVEADGDHQNDNTFDPLCFGYQIENKWVVDALKKEDYHLDGIEKDARYGTIYRLLKARKPGPLSHFIGGNQETQYNRIWLAPQWGFLAVRSEIENDSPKLHGLVVYQTNKAEKRGNIWFPTSGTMDFYAIEGGRKVLLIENKLDVTKFVLNHVSDSVFNPHLGPGAYVKNGETNEYWQIGANGQRKYIDIGANKETANIFLNWLFVLSIILLLMLGMGALLRWRRLHKTA
jgi:hypothetical protein